MRCSLDENSSRFLRMFFVHFFFFLTGSSIDPFEKYRSLAQRKISNKRNSSRVKRLEYRQTPNFYFLTLIFFLKISLSLDCAIYKYESSRFKRYVFYIYYLFLISFILFVLLCYVIFFCFVLFLYLFVWISRATCRAKA